MDNNDDDTNTSSIKEQHSCARRNLLKGMSHWTKATNQPDSQYACEFAVYCESGRCEAWIHRDIASNKFRLKH